MAEDSDFPTADPGDDAKRQSSGLRGFAVRAVLVLVSSLVGLLLCEGILRSFVRIGSFQWVSDSSLHWNLDDPLRKYALTPGFTGRIDAPEFSHPVQINSLGFRGPEPEPTDAPLFLIGDSFAFGVGAQPDQTIASRLETYLRPAMPDLDVWNLGVPSYSSPQYRQSLELYRRQAAPRQVVVCLYIGHMPSDANDLWGAVTFEREREAQSAPLEVAPEPASPTPKASSSGFSFRRAGRKLIKRLQRRSALYAFVAARVAPSLRAWLHARHELKAGEQEHLERGWQLLRRDLEAIRQMTEQDGASLLIVHIPEASSVIGGDWRMLEPLRELTAELGLTLLDFQSVFSTVDGHELYYPLDGHLNPRGYDRVAEEIAEVLKISGPEEESPRIPD